MLNRPRRNDGDLAAQFAHAPSDKNAWSFDGETFYLDLLFFHRRLRRLVAIQLKLDRFKATHKGQMELYLKWLDKHERQPSEEAPLA